MKYILILLFLKLFLEINAFALVTPVNNFDKVIENVYRGERLSDHEDKFKFLYELGVKVIVNLEFFHGEDSEFCERYDFECVKFSIFLPPVVYADRYFNYKKLVEAFKFIVKEPGENNIVYIHCYHGSDRTGALSASIKIRGFACGTSYDQEELRNIIKNDLEDHGFHSSLYPDLKSKILGWTQEIPEWICQ